MSELETRPQMDFGKTLDKMSLDEVKKFYEIEKQSAINIAQRLVEMLKNPKDQNERNPATLAGTTAAIENQIRSMNTIYGRLRELECESK